MLTIHFYFPRKKPTSNPGWASDLSPNHTHAHSEKKAKSEATVHLRVSSDANPTLSPLAPGRRRLAVPRPAVPFGVGPPRCGVSPAGSRTAPSRRGGDRPARPVQVSRRGASRRPAPSPIPSQLLVRPVQVTWQSRLDLIPRPLLAVAGNDEPTTLLPDSSSTTLLPACVLNLPSTVLLSAL